MNSSSGDSQPLLLGHGGDDRSLYCAHVPNLDAWPAHLDEPKAHFVALVAMNATGVQGNAIAAFAKKLISQGMVYLFAWGPDCKRVHDIFDEERGKRVETDTAFVPTDSFGDEDLDDALWDAIFAVPSDDYIETCRAVLAIVVDQPEWSARVEADLRDFEAFNDRILSQDELIERS